MTEYIVGEIYAIVSITENTIFGIFKEMRQYNILDFMKKNETEPKYKVINEYVFIDNENPNITFSIQDFLIKNKTVEIIPTVIPIK